MLYLEIYQSTYGGGETEQRKRKRQCFNVESLICVCSMSQLPCKVMAVLLHFFFLSAFAWMLVEGLHLYSMVVKVFGSEGSKHFYYYGIGWGRRSFNYNTQMKTKTCFLRDYIV